MPGQPSLIHEQNNISRLAPTVERLFFHGNPITGKGAAGTILELLALIANVRPSMSFADIPNLLLNTTLPIGFFAFVSNASADPQANIWALYLYNGPTRDSLASYFLIATEQGAGGGATNIYQLAAVDTAVAEHVLDFAGNVCSTFVGSAPFAVAKDVSTLNDLNALKLEYIFTNTDVAGTLHFIFANPCQSGDSKFNAGTQIFTPDEPGRHKVTGTFDGSAWILEFNMLPIV